MKRKIYVWFGILFMSFILVGCEELDTASSNTNKEQTSSEQSKKASKKKKKKKNKKKSKKKKKSVKRKKTKKKSKVQSNKKNMVYYNPLDDDVKEVRKECKSEFEDIYDVDRGRAFDSYFAISKWKSREDDGDVYVEFYGVFPEEKDHEYEESQIESGMKVHITYEKTSALVWDLGWSVQSAYLCDKNDEFICMLDGEGQSSLEEIAYAYYLMLTNQY